MWKNAVYYNKNLKKIKFWGIIYYAKEDLSTTQETAQGGARFYEAECNKKWSQGAGSSSD